VAVDLDRSSREVALSSRDGTKIHTWGGPKLNNKKKFMKKKINIYFIFNKILHIK